MYCGVHAKILLFGRPFALQYKSQIEKPSLGENNYHNYIIYILYIITVMINRNPCQSFERILPQTLQPQLPFIIEVRDGCDFCQFLRQ